MKLTPEQNEIAQSMYDQVVENLSKMTDRCVIGDDDDCECVYDDGNGNHCAIGGLMTKEELDIVKKHDMNIATPASDVIEKLELKRFGYNSNRGFKNDALLIFYNDLQTIHDNLYNWDENGFSNDGFESLTKIAENYGLTPHTKEY